MTSHADRWPALPYDDWQATQATLHRWTQIVGKVKLELTPFLNEWWNVPLFVTGRGLTTGLIPYGDGAFEVRFDFIDHLLRIDTVDGRSREYRLVPCSVATFYRDFFGLLRSLGIEVAINPVPSEIPDAIAFDVDHANASYDAEAVRRWWRILTGVHGVMQRFRTPFAGKSSPIMFFWGSFDLTATRFSGRPASLPDTAPRFMQLAEDQENFACGFWPGNANYTGHTLGEPAFYAYIFPDPPVFKDTPVRPEAAAYHADLGQFILPYAAVRQAPDPAAAALTFLQATYEAAAHAAGWDRTALELPPGVP